MLILSKSDEDRKVVQASVASERRFPVGFGIRNGWSLWAADSPLKRHAVNTYRLLMPTISAS